VNNLITVCDYRVAISRAEDELKNAASAKRRHDLNKYISRLKRELTAALRSIKSTKGEYDKAKKKTIDREFRNYKANSEEVTQ